MGAKTFIISLLVLSGIAACGDPAAAQLLSRPLPEYSNYAIEGYRRMGREAHERLTNLIYDEFGNLLMDGTEIYRLSQAHPAFDDPRTGYREAGSVFRKGVLYHDYMARLMVAQDTYAGPQQRLIIGDRIRTRFTSLTTDLATLNGIRWDTDLPRHQFTLISSRVDRPIFGLEAIFDYEPGYTEPIVTRGLSDLVLTAYLLGGHWHTRVGIFDLGATYVNQFRVDTQVGLRHNSFKGALPIREPGGLAPAVRPSSIEYLVVKFADGTDKDGQGARVFDVRIFINGVQRDDIRPRITRHDTELINTTYPNGDRFFPPNRSIPPYVELLKGFLPEETVPSAGFLEASRTEYLLYWFEMPSEDVQEVSFEALVANDYDISVAEVYTANPLASQNQPESRNRATYFYRVQGAKGRVADLSNLRWVRFNYGRQTGTSVAGLNLSTEVLGFQLQMEYAGNFNYWQYPNFGGKYHDRRASAYYVNVKKSFQDFSLGGEYFNMSPYYTTRLSIQSGQFNEYTGPYYGEIGGSFEVNYNNTLEVDLVDDNDDRDPFPDTHFLPSKGDNNGIFPGLDEDQDGRPDTNQNNNSLPDYFEPFLLYAVDPDDFAYGDDMNNNGVIDVRENDDKPDYPYDQDLQGFHLFGGLNLGRGLTLTLGHLDTRQIIGGGRNRATYGKLDYVRDLPLLGEIRLIDFLKRVRDDIQNDVFRYGFNHTFGPLGPIIPVGAFGVNPQDVVGIGVTEFEDPRRLRNSLVNTFFLEGRLKRLQNFNLRSNLKYEVNLQRKTSFQEDNRIGVWTSVVAADYRWEIRGLSIRPQMKYMVQRRSDQQEVVQPIFETFFYPILRLDYKLTPQTVLKAGVQGLPPIPSVFHDLHNDSRDYRSEDYLVMLTNTSVYSGYDLSCNMGYQFRQLQMEDRSRKAEDIDYSLFFIRLIVGLRLAEAR